MRRLLVPVVVGPVVVGVAVALAGCHGVKVDLAASPTAGSHSGKSGSSDSSGSGYSTVQAPGPLRAGSGPVGALSEPQAGLAATYGLNNGARSSIGLTMYELIDTTGEN